MLLLQDEHERHFVDRVVLQHACIPTLDDVVSLVHSNDFEGMGEVSDWDLLDLQHIIRVKDGFKILSCQELGLELVEGVVVGVGLAELLALDGLEHLEHGGLGVSRLLVQDVRHQFLFQKIKYFKVTTQLYNKVTASVV